MVIAAFILLILVTGFVAAYTGNIQGTTLYVGKEIAGPGMEHIAPRGFQDAITPRFQSNLNLITPLLIVTTLAVGFIISWWMVFVAVIALLFSYSIAGAVLPRKLNHYLLLIISSLQNRQADYVKSNDTMRAEAAGEVVELLVDYADEVMPLDLPVPRIKGSKTAELS